MANGDAFYGWPRVVYYDTNKNFLGYIGTDRVVSVFQVSDITNTAPSGSVYFRISVNGPVRFSISSGYSFQQDKGGFDTDGSISNDAFTHIETYLPISDLAGASISWVEDSNSGGSVEGTTYTITNNLTNCTTNNNANSISANSSYSATISANSGYTLGSIAVTMGGNNITSSAVSGSRISINSVTGNVVITANATKTGTTGEQWSTTPQTITADKRYLWSYQKITLTNGTTIETKPCIIGVYGDTGSSGGSIDTSNFATKADLANKQNLLVSGTNIKTINGQSLLGDGNIAITSSGGSSGGSSSNISITVNDANYTATNNVITLPNYLTIPKDKKITIIGDSITYGFDGTDASLVAKPYPWIIQDLLGVPVYNYGISGSTITGGGASTSIPGNSPMNIRYTDMVYADYALVLGGVNDYAIISAPLGKKGDTTNQTFYGALRILIEGLITKYPTGKIGFMTPLRKANDTAPNVAGFTLKQYRDAIIDMCEDYCIPVLDLYTKGGCHPNIGAWRNANLPDGLHPNQAYYRKLALQIAQFIQSI